MIHEYEFLHISYLKNGDDLKLVGGTPPQVSVVRQYTISAVNVRSVGTYHRYWGRYDGFYSFNLTK